MWFFKHIINIITQPGRGKRVFVGVSGGVDSSVSALMLKLYGYNVTGIFIRTWQPDWIECTWRDERRDAMRVCAHLEIPFIELDLEQEYKQGVADYMIAEYKKGRTPNPDVMCNREVKFGGFLKWVLEQNADYIATGHYAQNISNKLVKGIDESKDQSYFLWTLTQIQLQHVLFPIGHIQKKNVRTLASWYKLPTALKKDSQGICFIGEIDMKDFLKHYIDEVPGDVIDESGNVIGHHNGVLMYTLGERHGFTITKKGISDAPYYVIGKDIKNNILIVSSSPEVKTKSQEIKLVDCVWRELETDKTYTAQIRYHGELKSCRIIRTKNDYSIIFDESDATIAQGQSVVLYDNSVCIGGGVVA
jgi:tRNA-specific 2-thiouridylase